MGIASSAFDSGRAGASSRSSPVAAAVGPHDRAIGTGMRTPVHPAYNEVHGVQGDRGNSGAPSMMTTTSYLANGASPLQPPTRPPPMQTQYVSAPVGSSSGAGHGTQAPAAKDTLAAPGRAPLAPGSFGQGHGGYGNGPPPPPPPAVMATMMRMGAPQPPQHVRQAPGSGGPPLVPGTPMNSASGFFPPTLAPAVGPAKPALVSHGADPVDDDDDDGAESAAPEFTLQYDDDD